MRVAAEFVVDAQHAVPVRQLAIVIIIVVVIVVPEAGDRADETGTAIVVVTL